METKNKKTDNKYDAIKIMREIRDKLSLEIMNMTYIKERAYLDKLLKEDYTNRSKSKQITAKASLPQKDEQ